MKYCRFCRKKTIREIFPANKKGRGIHVKQFACTNIGFGIHGPIIACANCQIIYVDEKITQQKISTYYEVVDDPQYFLEQNAREITFKNYLSKLEKVFPQKGKLLDVGTNTGLFVKLAMDNGWDAVGLEPNRWSAEYAKKHYGITLVNKPFSSGIFPKKNFSVVTMWDVIEHFTDPVSEIKKVYDYLSPDGLFAFSTVDPSSPLAKLMGTRWSWYMEMHRVFLNKAASRWYLEKTGFKNIKFKPHWRFLSAGYLASRLQAVNPLLSEVVSKTISFAGLDKTIIPYYANDLFDCYAFK